ncbi:MAG: hypothetical protein ACRYG2_08215 [Janthinobacterium lividum]
MPKPDESDLAPFYAVAGLADVIADMFRESVAARQRKAEERLAEIRDRRLERIEQARVNADELREFLSTLPEQFRALPETTRIRLAELQRQAEELVAQAGDTYSSLAGRGKRVVDDRVGDVRTAGRAARQAAEENLDEAAEAVQPLVDQAQEAVTEVRRNVTGRAARARTAPKPADDVTPESATPAARAAAAATTAKTAGTSTEDAVVSPAQALAQEREAKKAGAKRSTAKKSPAKKTPADKIAAGETPVRAAPKKAPAATRASASKAPSVPQNGVAENDVAQNAVPSPGSPEAEPTQGPGTAS